MNFKFPKSIFFKSISLITFSLFLSFNLSAQTVFWSDNFDLPAGGVNFNNAGVGWSGSTPTPGGGPNTSIFGLSNSWIIGANVNGGICVSGNKLYIKAIGSANSYTSDVFTDKLDATPSISTAGVTNISLVFTWRCDGVSGQDYGLVGLSSDNGATWNWLPTNYQGANSCTNATIIVPSNYEGITTF